MMINEKYKGLNLRAVTYNRCSTDEQESALEVQISQSADICRAYGWTLIEQYIELESGRSTENRSRYLDMIADMKKNKFDVIIIKSLDRLTRSTKDWNDFQQEMFENKKRLYIYMEGSFFELSQQFMYNIKNSFDSYFSKQLSEKLKNSHKNRQDNLSGVNISRKMFGWDKVGKNEYVVNEQEAGYIRYAVQMLKEGHGFYSISQRLYEMGARNTLGKPIQASVWRQMCLSPKLYGCFVMRKTVHNFELRRNELQPPENWIYYENALPPIISKQDFTEIQTIIKSRFKPDCRSAYSGKYPLSGKIVCGCCGTPFHRLISTFHNGDKAAMWKCGKAQREGREKAERLGYGCNCECVREDKLMELIGEASEKQFAVLFDSNNGIIERCLKIIRKAIKESSSTAKLDKLKAEYTRQIERKEFFLDKLVDGLISESDFKLKNDKLSVDIKRLSVEIAVLEADLSNLTDNEKRLERIKEALENTDIIAQAKGSAVLGKIEKIIVNNDATVTIVYDKYKLIGLKHLQNEDIDLGNLFSVTVPYSGFAEKKARTGDEKKRLYEIIKSGKGDLTYNEYAELLGENVTKKHVASRLRQLIKADIVRRNEEGLLVVTGEYRDGI